MKTYIAVYRMCMCSVAVPTAVFHACHRPTHIHLALQCGVAVPTAFFQSRRLPSHIHIQALANSKTWFTMRVHMSCVELECEDGGCCNINIAPT